MSKISFVVFGSAALVACGSAPTFQQYAKYTADEEARRHSNMGHLAVGVQEGYLLENDAEATPVRGGIVSVDHRESFPVSFNRIDGTRICFDQRLSVDHADQLPKQVSHLQNDFGFAVQTWDALDAVPEVWPMAQAATVTQQPASQRELKLTGPNAARHPTAEICVTTPTLVVGPQTKFLTLAVLAKEAPSKNFALVWDFSGTKRR